MSSWKSGTVLSSALTLWCHQSARIAWAFSQPVLCVIVSDHIISMRQRENNGTELDATFGDEEVTYDQLMQIGRKFFLAVYAQKHSLTLNADKRFGVIN